MKPFTIVLEARPEPKKDDMAVVCAIKPDEGATTDERVFAMATGAAAAKVVAKCLKLINWSEVSGLTGAEIIDRLAEQGLIPEDVLKPDDPKPAKKTKKEERKPAKKVKRPTSVAEGLLHEARRMIDSPDPSLRKAGEELRDRILRECDPLDPPEVKRREATR